MFDFDDFLDRARTRLLQEPPKGWNHADDGMRQRAAEIPAGQSAKAAAVLVPIVQRAEPTVLLTVRQGHLAQHAGQIAFPGGRTDAGETALDAALRESEEEIGLARKFVQPIGYADGFLTITHYVVSPVVALVEEGFSLAPHEGEVAEVFEVPLSFLMDVQNCQRHSRIAQGLARYYYVYPFGDRQIWGATAGMIRNIYERLYA